MPIEGYYNRKASPQMIQVVMYYIDFIKKNRVLPDYKVAAIDLGLKGTHLCRILKLMEERGFVEKLGVVKENGHCEGYKFYPELMGIKESDGNE